MQKKAHIREGEKRVLIVEMHTDKKGNQLIGKWLDVPYIQCIEEGNIHLIHEGIEVVVPCDDIMFNDCDVFVI